jgi:hypothetical protein
MAGKPHDDDRVCCSERADGSCAGLLVRRLSQVRVNELAEEIWTASTGSVPPARSHRDPRASRPGASAQAAYRRRRQQEREAWRPGWGWRAVAAVAAGGAGALLTGLTVGAWLAWPMALLATGLTAWRLRFRPSAGASVWRRQAAAQRRTAGRLRPLEDEGVLVLHDVVLPGWPAGLDHLVAGPTGVWAVESWPRGRLTLRRGTGRAAGVPAGPLRALGWQTAAVAGVLAGGASVPVKPLLCVHGGSWLAGSRSVQGVRVARPRQLGRVVREGPPAQPGEVERAAARLLEALRPAA